MDYFVPVASILDINKLTLELSVYHKINNSVCSWLLKNRKTIYIYNKVNLIKYIIISLFYHQCCICIHTPSDFYNILLKKRCKQINLKKYIRIYLKILADYIMLVFLNEKCLYYMSTFMNDNLFFKTNNVITNDIHSQFKIFNIILWKITVIIDLNSLDTQLHNDHNITFYSIYNNKLYNMIKNIIRKYSL